MVFSLKNSIQLKWMESMGLKNKDSDFTWKDFQGLEYKEEVYN